VEWASPTACECVLEGRWYAELVSWMPQKGLGLRHGWSVARLSIS